MRAKATFRIEFMLKADTYQPGDSCGNLDLSDEQIEELHSWGVVRIEGRADVNPPGLDVTLDVHSTTIQSQGVIR